MSKVEPKAIKVYKPEIMNCPKCNAKLVFAYTASNKVIQFSSGKIIKIKNMAYRCPNCNDGNIYSSLTAHKMSLKGYTYSTKVICTIEYYKSMHKSREEICDMLASKDIEISDRNVDIIYKKIKGIMELDSDKLVKESYERQMKEFNEIRIAVDHITINPYHYVVFYDYFNGEILGLWKCDGTDDPKLHEYLKKYLNNPNIKYVVTVRPQSKVYGILKSYAPNSSKFLSFAKF